MKMSRSFFWDACLAVIFALESVLCFCRMLVYKLRKQRDEEYDDNGAVCMISLFLAAVLGIIGGFFCGLNETAFFHFGAAGWLIALGVMSAIIFVITAITEDNFPLLGLGCNILLGTIFGYAIAYSLSYLIIWLLKLVLFQLFFILILLLNSIT